MNHQDTKEYWEGNEKMNHQDTKTPRNIGKEMRK
jgi:hypothetical protein